MGSFAEHDDNLYCHSCFRKFYATKGYDFGQGTLQLELKEAKGQKTLESIAPKVIGEEDFRSVPLRNVHGSRDKMTKR